MRSQHQLLYMLVVKIYDVYQLCTLVKIYDVYQCTLVKIYDVYQLCAVCTHSINIIPA